MKISDISEAELPMNLQGLGQLTRAGVKLQRGSKGDDVKSLQKLLNTFGYPLSVDGIFGPATEAAVRQVQAKLGLTSTGMWDSTTAAQVNAVTKSGVIDAGPKDKAIIAQVVKDAAAPVVSIAPSVMPGSQQPVMLATGGGFFDTVKAKVRAFIADPNYPYFVAGALAVVLGGAWLLWRGPATTKTAKPVQLGLGRTRGASKKRKSKAKKKSSKKIYVHFAASSKGPFLTKSFVSTRAAQQAVREARAAGETAHIAED